MKRLAGWLGLILAVVVGIAASAGAVYAVAPVAPRLVVLPLVALATAIVVAALLARGAARWARVSRRRAGVVAGMLAALPTVALLLLIWRTPARPEVPRPADTRPAPQRVALDTGSTVAMWRLPPRQRTHATPVVFLHGGPGGSARDRDFAIGAAFREAGFETVYFDQAGSGASDDLPVGAYSVARSVADLEALRRHLRTPRMVLWGQSWGASLAAAYTQQHPEQVAGVIADSPGHYPGDPVQVDYTITDEHDPFQPTPRDAVLYLLLTYAPQLADEWLPQARHKNALPRQPPTGYQCKGAPPLPAFKPGGAGSLYTNRRLLVDVVRQPLREGAISQAPALVLRGACDYIQPSAANRYVAAFPNATFRTVPDVGHAFFGNDAALMRELTPFARDGLAGVP